MTKRSVTVWITALCLLLRPAVGRAEVMTVGESVADADGAGTIQFAVDPAADPASTADQLAANVALSEGAQVQAITVENGIATIEFSGATAGATVVATLPSEVAAAVGVSATVAGEETSTAAVVGGGLLAVVGGIFGGLAASGALDDDEGIPVTGLQ